MLIVRSKQKVLNIARIKPALSEEYLIRSDILKEWFVRITGLGAPGMATLLFVHRTTRVGYHCPGKITAENHSRVYIQAGESAGILWCRPVTIWK